MSHELNHDHEVWLLTDQFGDRALRVWLELLSIFDRHENRLRLTPEQVSAISRITRHYPKNVWRIILHMVETGWLTVLERSLDNSPKVLGLTNYSKYHRTPEPQRKVIAPDRGAADAPLLSDPILSDPRLTLKKEKKEEDKSAASPPPHQPWESFEITPAMRRWVVGKNLPDPDDQLEQFQDHFRKTGGKMSNGQTVKDWQAAFRTWMRNSVKFAGKSSTTTQIEQTLNWVAPEKRGMAQ